MTLTRVIYDWEIDDVRAQFVARGMDPLIASHVPASFFLYGLSHGFSVDEMWHHANNTQFPDPTIGWIRQQPDRRQAS